jgi:hypothetical protein
MRRDVFTAGGRMPDPADPTKTIAIGVIKARSSVSFRSRAVISVAFGGPDKDVLPWAFRDVSSCRSDDRAGRQSGRSRAPFAFFAARPPLE